MMRRVLQGAALFLGLLAMVSLAVAEEALQPLSPPSMATEVVEKAPMADIHDIAPPLFMGLSSAAKEAMMVGWLVLVVVILGLLGLWLWFRRKQGTKREATFFQPPEVMAHMALDRIAPLMDRDGKAFYFELSEVVKHYLKGRFRLNAPEMTAEELLLKLPVLSVTLEQKRAVSTLFSHAEPVKFAGVIPDFKAMVGDLAAMRHFVTETTPQEETAEAGR